MIDETTIRGMSKAAEHRRTPPLFEAEENAA